MCFHVVSGSVNLFSQYACENDLVSNSVIYRVMRKLPNKFRKKLLTHIQEYDVSQWNLGVSSGLLRSCKTFLWHLRRPVINLRPISLKIKKKNSSFAATTNSDSPTKMQSLLQDGDQKIRQKHAFKKMKMSKRHEGVKKCSRYLIFLGSTIWIGQCEDNWKCGNDACCKRHKRLL